MGLVRALPWVPPERYFLPDLPVLYFRSTYDIAAKKYG